jgi:hypothetical protein
VGNLVDAGCAIAIPQENAGGGGDHYVNSRSFRAAARSPHTGRCGLFCGRLGLFALFHRHKNDMCRFSKQELFAVLTF